MDQRLSSRATEISPVLQPYLLTPRFTQFCCVIVLKSDPTRRGRHTLPRDKNKCLEQGKELLALSLQQGCARMTSAVQTAPDEVAACGCCTAAWKDRPSEPAMLLFDFFT